MPSIQKKICLLGDFAVGKTSLIRRYVEGRFEDKYLSTIGTKISRKTVALPTDTEIIDMTMLIWDLAGGEKFDRMTGSYYRGAAGAVIVCDLPRPETLDSIIRYAQDFLGINTNAPLVIVGNKAVLAEQRLISTEELIIAARPWQPPRLRRGRRFR